MPKIPLSSDWCDCNGGCGHPTVCVTEGCSLLVAHALGIYLWCEAHKPLHVVARFTPVCDISLPTWCRAVR